VMADQRMPVLVARSLHRFSDLRPGKGHCAPFSGLAGSVPDVG
jgi:hypothetical protein